MKTSEFAALEPFSFFAQLAQNNNRPWFAQNKPRYQAIRQAWIAGMQRMVMAVAQEWPEMAYADISRNTYRIYRDIRFSQDKSPFKTHISSSMTIPRWKGSHLGVYIEAGNKDADTGIYGGIWMPETTQLRKLRKAIADNNEEWMEIVLNPELTGVYGKDWVGDRLKTAPKGYPREHPMVEYLRLKDIGKFRQLTPEFFNSEDWPEKMARLILPLRPLINFLEYSLFEEN